MVSQVEFNCGFILSFCGVIYSAGPDGRMHTGPSASPENSYTLHLNRKSPFAERHVRVVTHSPNIDIAILRQISNIYCTAMQWAMTDKNTYPELDAYVKSTDYTLDDALSKKLKALVMKLPHDAVPTATAEAVEIANKTASSQESLDILSYVKSALKFPFTKKKPESTSLPQHVIDEYVKMPFLSNRSNMKRLPHLSNPNSDRLIDVPSHQLLLSFILCYRYVKVPKSAVKEPVPSYVVSEEVDRSHRHFSGLLWLFPGTFLPSALPLNGQSNSQPSLYTSARNLLKKKIQAGGGHTSWSGVWEACLLARLRDIQGEMFI